MIDPLLDEAKEWSRKQGYVSVSYIQRIMRVGYTRASRLVDLMIEQEFCEAEYVEGKGYRALKICPTQLAPDAGESAASSGIVNASAESTFQAEPTPTQRG